MSMCLIMEGGVKCINCLPCWKSMCGLKSLSVVLSMYCSVSPDIIPSGWLGSKYQLTNLVYFNNTGQSIKKKIVLIPGLPLCIISVFIRWVCACMWWHECMCCQLETLWLNAQCNISNAQCNKLTAKALVKIHYHHCHYRPCFIYYYYCMNPAKCRGLLLSMSSAGLFVCLSLGDLS